MDVPLLSRLRVNRFGCRQISLSNILAGQQLLILQQNLLASLILRNHTNRLETNHLLIDTRNLTTLDELLQSHVIHFLHIEVSVTNALLSTEHVQNVILVRRIERNSITELLAVIRSTLDGKAAIVDLANIEITCTARICRNSEYLVTANTKRQTLGSCQRYGRSLRNVILQFVILIDILTNTVFRVCRFYISRLLIVTTGTQDTYKHVRARLVTGSICSNGPSRTRIHTRKAQHPCHIKLLGLFKIRLGNVRSLVFEVVRTFEYLRIRSTKIGLILSPIGNQHTLKGRTLYGFANKSHCRNTKRTGGVVNLRLLGINAGTHVRLPCVICVRRHT